MRLHRVSRNGGMTGERSQSKIVYVIAIIAGLVLIVALTINAYRSGREDAARERANRAARNAR